MKIDLDAIVPEGLRLTGEESSAILDLSDEAFVRGIGPIRYDLAVNLVSDELLVRGSLRVEISLRCSRCGEFFGREVEEGAYSYNENVADAVESVDLTDDIREAIILTFPLYPVCVSECKGLCPQCGVNLNNNKCECKPPDDVRWAALDDLGNVD